MAKIRSNSVKKILDRLKTIAGNKERYAEFYDQYDTDPPMFHTGT